MKTAFAILVAATLIACGGDSASGPKTSGRSFSGVWITVMGDDTVFFHPTQSGSAVSGYVTQPNADTIHFAGVANQTTVSFTVVVPYGDSLLTSNYHGSYIDDEHITGDISPLGGVGEAQREDLTKIR